MLLNGYAWVRSRSGFDVVRPQRLAEGTRHSEAWDLRLQAVRRALREAAYRDRLSQAGPLGADGGGPQQVRLREQAVRTARDLLVAGPT
jgi:hypothetical protein